MSDACTALPQGSGFVSSITGFIDCQAQTLGFGAWSAFAAPGSTLTVVLTGFLTIFIAIIGYNLLLGRTMSVREGTLAFVKIGAVFALATSWPAYRTLVHDLVTDGPAQLVAEIGPQAGVVGSDGTLVQRLDLADHALAQLAILGPGNAPADARAQVAPPPFGGSDAFALGGSRILFLLGAVGALAIVKVLTGLMLALGPFFIAFLMFENTRSLFEGWVRVLAGTALASVGVAVTLSLELSLLEPWLASVLARRTAGEALPTIATELFVIVCLFTIVIFAALWGSARVARAFRLAPLQRLAGSPLQHPRRSPAIVRPGERDSAVAETRSRAGTLAHSLITENRRDRAEPVTASAGGMPSAGRQHGVRHSNSQAQAPTPVGRTFTRRHSARVSAHANRRDARA